MSNWIIEPLDPLIVRDGRPFYATPGARAKSLSFPFPSTTTGGVRTRAGQDANGRFDEANIPAVLDIRVRGPLLAEQDGNSLRLLVPAPLDAVVFDASTADKTVQRRYLAPVEHGDAVVDMPTGVTHLVGMPNARDEKPSKQAPRFWYWDEAYDWLLNAQDDAAPLEFTQLGHNGPTHDRRVHVGIDSVTQTGKDGALFATSGLTFWHNVPDADDNLLLSGAKKLALVTAVDNPGSLSIEPGLASLGGERRVVRWRQAPDALLPAEIPPELADRIVAAGACRVVLLTPACFTQGWRPDWLRQSRHNVTPTLLAAAVGQPAVVSGWDYAKHGPKPTRRLAPAGSVYFLVLNGAAETDIRTWLDEIWFRCISDELDDRQAGFGLAVVGTWSGTAVPITFDQEAQSCVNHL